VIKPDKTIEDAPNSKIAAIKLDDNYAVRELLELMNLRS
jgi:hypothetical protein